MPRRARLDAPGALHHIMVRGINKAAIFSDDQDRQKFLKRLGENIDAAKCGIEGGLIRSKGGWSKVESARRKSEREEYDERILGSADFVNAVYKELEEKARLQLKLRRTGRTISKIIDEKCDENKVSVHELKGGSRRKKVCSLRRQIARRGLDELGLSMAEIARHVGVSTSGIARAVKRLEGGTVEL